MYVIKTEKEAIKESILTWHSLTMNDSFTKEKYAMLNPKVNSWKSQCACCEYYMNTLRETPLSNCKRNRSGCPLSSSSICGFASHNSAYSLYEEGTNKSANARKILDSLLFFWKTTEWIDSDVSSIMEILAMPKGKKMEKIKMTEEQARELHMETIMSNIETPVEDFIEDMKSCGYIKKTGFEIAKDNYEANVFNEEDALNYIDELEKRLKVIEP